MSVFLEKLAARRRFGMKPGLDAIRAVCSALGDPQKRVRAIHVAGTNGKGAVCAILDSVLRAGGLRVGRYTSPHLVRLNERFFLDGAPVADDILDRAAARVETACSAPDAPNDVTFFEALTATAFLLYAEARTDAVVLETGLGGRLDATNVCRPLLTIITRIGLDHCDWLGETVAEIAHEKAGIVKPGVPVVLGENLPEVVDLVRRRAAEAGAPFHYAPELASDAEIPDGFALGGRFNRENAVTALAALRVIARNEAIPTFNFQLSTVRSGFSSVIWPGRFQRVGHFLIDGAHNPPAARALVASLREEGFNEENRLHLIAGFCGDKDVDETLAILKPLVASATAVKTNNPRSLSAEALVAHLNALGIPAIPAPSLRDLVIARREAPWQSTPSTLVCGSLFLAGEALAALGAYPWGEVRFDAAERLKSDRADML